MFVFLQRLSHYRRPFANSDSLEVFGGVREYLKTILRGVFGQILNILRKKSTRNWLIACERRRISAFRVRNWVGKQQPELRLRSITLYMLFITNPWCVQTTVLAHAWKVENLMYQLLQHQQPRLLLHLDYLVHLDLSPGKRTNLSQFIMHIPLSCNRF